MNRLHVIIGFVGMSFAGALFCLGSEMKISAQSGEVRAVDETGAMVWRIERADAGGVMAEKRADGSILLSDGTLIDALGRVAARVHGTGGAPMCDGSDGRGGCPGWSELAEITPPSGDGQSNSHGVPMFDRQGNAWVVNTFVNSGSYALQIRKSNGHDGTWGPLETISNTTRYVAGPEGVIDRNDNITIVFRDIQSGYKLYNMRYTPAGGWVGPTLVYTTSTFFQAIEAGVDNAGNVAAVFDPSNSVWSAVYDNSTGTWGTATQISPAGYSTILPTVISDKNRQNMYAIYLVRSGGPVGLYANKFDSATKTWGPAELLPGTETASFGIAGPASRLTAVMGPAGGATVFWQSGEPYGIYASHIENGVWQTARELLAPGVYDADMENFAHAATDGDTAYGILTRYEDGQIHLYIISHSRYGHSYEVQNPAIYAYNVSTRCRIAPYLAGRWAATFLAPQDGTPQLTSMLGECWWWIPGWVDVPSTWSVFFQEVGYDRHEPLLVMEAEEFIGDNFGIWASWLRNLPADVNEDGEVNLSDLAGLLSMFNESGANLDYDFNCDGWVDLQDLAELLGEYGQACTLPD